MKNFFLLFFVLILFASCAKTVQKKVEDDLITQVITNGQWKITSFIKGSNDVTADFSGFIFQFMSDRTVNAMRNGAVNATGSWEANINNRTITSGFQNQQYPLALLNGVWTITKNSWTFVEANQTVNNELYNLRLDKE